jgi:hypothetical protein
VSTAERDAAARDNAAAASRVEPGTGDWCKQGYVWRGACGPADHVSGTLQQPSPTAWGQPRRRHRRGLLLDWQPAAGSWWSGCAKGAPGSASPLPAGPQVCVAPGTRTQAAYDNSQAALRWAANVAATTYGPNTCAKGYVWRQIDTADWVCVEPSARQQALSDNANACAAGCLACLRWAPPACPPARTCMTVPADWPHTPSARRQAHARTPPLARPWLPAAPSAV